MFTAVALLSVPYLPRGGPRPTADLAAWDGAPLEQPSLFIGGELDPVTGWMAGAVRAFPTTLPSLTSSHLLTGCGHWVQQERPDEVNQILVDWLRSVARDT
jgi:pimeloyl-ACP methyl ester carboxylesterase